MYITVNYSMSIEPDSNDRFALTYRYLGGEDTATIEVNAYDLDDSQGLIQLGDGEYEITNIHYLGNNTNIDSEGYACINMFHVSRDEDDYSYIKLAIGQSSSIALGQEYGNVLYAQYGHPVDALSDPAVVTTQENPAPITEASTEMPVTEADITESIAVTESIVAAEDITESLPAADVSSDASADASTEDLSEELLKEVNKENPKSSIFKRLAPVYFIIVVAVIVYFIIKKTGSFNK